MASGSIKGITIEIEGKTSGLVKSLGNVNKALNETQKALKTVDKALKLDPKNVDILKTKQGLLSDAINETKQKLELEKKAAEDAAKALEEGTITKSQYDTLQAEVAKTTAELADLEKQSDQTNERIKELGGSSKLSAFTDALDKAAQKLKEIGESLTEIGEKLTKTATAAVAGFATASVAAYKNVDDGLDSIVKKTGATGAALEEMEDIAKSIATSIPTSFDIAGNAVGDVNTMFGVTGDRLEELTTAFIKFADINDSDVTGSVEGVQKVMAAYNVKEKDTEKLLDAMTVAGQKYAVSVDTIESALVSNQATFSELNMTLPQSIDFLGQLERSGIDSSTMLSGLSKALKNSTADGLTLDEGLAQLQDTMNNSENETEALQAAYDLFGKSGAQVYNAVKSGTIDFNKLGDASKTLNSDIGAVTQTYDDMTDGSDQLTVATNSAKLALAEVGGTLSETLAPIITKVSEKLKEFAEWWRNLDPNIQNTILIVGGFVAILGPLLVAIGKVSTGISALISFFGTMSAFITGTLVPGIATLGSTLMATLAPIAAVVLAITAVIMIIKNWDEIVEAAKYLWEEFCEFIKGIIESIQQAWESFQEFLTGLIEAFVEFWSEAWENIKQFFTGVWEGICNVVSGAWDTITGIFSGIGTWFTGKFQEAWDGITGIFGKFGDFFRGVWDTIVSIFTEVGTAVADAVSGAVRNVINQVLSGAAGIINGFISLLNGAIKIINKIPGVSLSTISKIEVAQLEKGGILKKGEIGLLEGNGAEAVVPLDQNKKWIQAVADQMQQSLSSVGSAFARADIIDYRPQLNQIIAAMQSGATIMITNQIDGQVFDRQVIKSVNRYNYRSGGR